MYCFPWTANPRDRFDHDAHRTPDVCCLLRNGWNVSDLPSHTVSNVWPISNVKILPQQMGGIHFRQATNRVRLSRHDWKLIINTQSLHLCVWCARCRSGRDRLVSKNFSTNPADVDDVSADFWSRLTLGLWFAKRATWWPKMKEQRPGFYPLMSFTWCVSTRHGWAVASHSTHIHTHSVDKHFRWECIWQCMQKINVFDSACYDCLPTILPDNWRSCA